MENVQFDIWSLLLSFGVFQGLFLIPAILKGNRLNSKFLAGLVLIISLNVFGYLLLSSRLYQVIPHLIFISNPLLFLLGPLFYFYIRASTQMDFRFNLKQHWAHFTPVLIGIYYHWNFYVLSGSSKVNVMNAFYATSDLQADNWLIAYFTIHTLQTLFYILKARTILSTVRTELNGSKKSEYIKWLSKFSLAFAAYWLINFTGLLWMSFADGFFHEVDYIIMLTSAAMIHTLAFVALSKNRFFNEMMVSHKKGKGGKGNLGEQEITSLLNGLNALMKKEKPFLDPELKMGQLAEMANLTTNKLSELLNEGVGKTFYEFVNDYRLEEVKSKLGDPEFANYTILGIALDSGFNNKNTFNRYFKKQTGQTPSEYMRENAAKGSHAIQSDALM